MEAEELGKLTMEVSDSLLNLFFFKKPYVCPKIPGMKLTAGNSRLKGIYNRWDYVHLLSTNATNPNMLLQ